MLFCHQLQPPEDKSKQAAFHRVKNDKAAAASCCASDPRKGADANKPAAPEVFLMARSEISDPKYFELSDNICYPWTLATTNKMTLGAGAASSALRPLAPTRTGVAGIRSSRQESFRCTSTVAAEMLGDEQSAVGKYPC
jgi:hypothetical protein